MDHQKVVIDEEAKKRLTALIAEDPLLMAARIRSYFEKAGITDPNERMRMVAEAMGRQTTQRMTAEQLMNYEQMLREREIMGGGAGAAERFGLKMGGSITANLEGVTNAWNNLLAAIGGPNGENIISFLQSLTSALNGLMGFFAEHPEAGKLVFDGLIGLAAALAALGAASIINAFATPGGTVILALGGLTAALAALGALDWEHLQTVFKGIKWAADMLKTIEERSSKGIEGGPIPWLADKTRKFLFGGTPEPAKPTPPTNAAPDVDPRYISPMRWDPSIDKKQILQPITMNLNLDGRTLAQAIADITEDLYPYSTQAPSSNAWNRFPNVDGSKTNT